MSNPVDSKKAVFFLSSDGPLANNNPNYEERLSQLKLTSQITNCFNENKIGVFEAGTGVGKSYAYLIPALMWVKENDQRVVISTGTINLQQQLAEKDCIKAQEITGINEKFLLIKGRQNYVCLRRLKDASEEKDLFSEETDELKLISEWVKTSDTGSKSELSFMPTESVWQRINSESEACMGNKCFYAEKCFVWKVRKAANEAKILIVNHHLLFSDIQVRLASQNYDDAAVLPPYKHLIFDEAHGIEDAATSFFSEALTRFSLQKQLNLLYRNRRSSSAGHLLTVSALSDANVSLDEIVAAIDLTKVRMQQLEDTAFDILQNNFTWRLHQSTAHVATELLKCFENLNIAIYEFVGLVRKLIEGVKDKDLELPTIWETKQILKRIDFLGLCCKNFTLWEERVDSVFWMEKRRLNSGALFVRFVETPLEISSTMNAGVFEPMESTVCVSATLQIAGEFGFWKYRTGLCFQPEERLVSGTFDSPFPYKDNLLFSVVTDAPSPTFSDFQPWLEDAVKKLIIASSGRTLVLFTSYDSLKNCYDNCSLTLTKEGYTVYKQGEDDRFRLLKRFREETNSVLFATDSFWEGVDIPGESLSHVIIVKLPFPVPSDPVFQARCEFIEKNNGNSFMELSIPKSVIQFKQGFGRLMRSSTDYGCVTVLDNRLVQKQYGRFFIQSVPKSKTNFAPLNEVAKRIKNFLG